MSEYFRASAQPNPSDLATATAQTANASTSAASADDSTSDQALLERFASDLARRRTDAEEDVVSENKILRESASKRLEQLQNTTPQSMLAEFREDERQRAEMKRKSELNAMNYSWKEFIRDRGDRYARCRLDNFVVTCPLQEDVLVAIRTYGEQILTNMENGRGLILIGPTGTGKDHLLTGLAHIVIGKVKRALGYDPVYGNIRALTIAWTSGTAWFAAARRAIDDECPSDPSEKLSSADILVVSDLVPPCGRLTDFQSELVFDVIDKRYSRMQTTWLSANVATREELEAGLGVAVTDRLCHDALILACDWPTYRRPLERDT